MRVNERMKKLLSIVLTLCMILSYIPAPAYAVGTDCTHHTEHTADCGYVAAVEGVPCAHVHDENCGYVEAVEEVKCACAETDENGALVHTEGCGYVAPVTGADCTHVHDDACGYVAAVEGHECHYECAECAEESSDPAPVCTCAEACTTENFNEYCDVCGFDYTACTGTDTAALYEDTTYPYAVVDTEAGTVTIDGTLGGKTDATEEDLTALVAALKSYVESGHTTIIVTGSQPAKLLKDGYLIPVVSLAFEQLTYDYQDEKIDSYWGTVDLIYQDVTEIVEYEFYVCDVLKSITLPKVTTVGDRGFWACYYLETLTFGSVVTAINDNSGEVFYDLGYEIDGCNLALNCGQLQEATEYQPNLNTNTWWKDNEWKSITLTHTEGTAATCIAQAVCSVCGESYGELGAHTAEPTYVPNAGDSTQHDATYSCCGATVTEAHTMNVTTGKCVCGADMTAIATVTDGTNTYYAADAATLNQAVTAILETGSRTFTVELPADAEAGMITTIRRAICDTEGVADGSIHLTLKGVTTIPGTTNWDGVAFGPGDIYDEAGEIVDQELVTQLASINLPDVTEIGAQAFYFCENLVTVSAPKAQTIGAQALGYTALTSVEFPELTTIPTDMFSGTWTLSSAKFPKVTTIEQGGLLVGAKFTPENNPTPFPLELTAEGNITFNGSNHFNIASQNYSGKVDLVLCCDKIDAVTFNEDGTATWQVREDLSYTFKSITFKHSYVNGKCTACGEDCTHTGGTATCTTLAVCDTCGVSYGAVDTTNHDSSVECENGFCPNGCYEPATLNAAGYYEIDNAGKLFWFAQQVNVKGNREIKGVLTANIDLENKPWTPIGVTGEENNNFRGVFDGQNYTIKGLYVEGSENGVGFFGEVRTGTVKNFRIYGNVVVNTEVNYVGGVIGSICGVNGETDLERNGAIIQNITSFVNVTAKAHGIGMIGGFVGYANHQSLIEQCAWYGTFDAGEYRVDSGAGGFIGHIYTNSSVTIRNCAAYGTIKTDYVKNSYNNYPTIYMGGFLSFSNTGAGTVLENCLFAGKFERGENLTDEAFLGAFGTLRSVNAIKNCYYLGDGVLEAVHSDSNLKPGSDNVEITSVTGEELRNNTIATQLGDHWMQDVHYPIPKDTKAHSDSATYTYTDNGDGTHKATCNECGYEETSRPHTIENHACTDCGAMEIVVSFNAGDYEWKTGDTLYFCRVSGDNEWEEYAFTATVAGDGTLTWTPDRTLYWDGTGEHKLVVIYPDTGYVWDTWYVDEDQATPETLRKNDRLDAIWSGNPTTDTITFNLKRRMAKVTVNYEAAEGVTISKAEVYTLTQYVFFDVDTLERRNIAWEEGDDLWIHSYLNDGQFTAFVSPDAYAAGGNFIKITLSDGSVREVKMNKAVTFAEGAEYTYKVVITADGAYLTCADECSFEYTANEDGLTHSKTCSKCGYVAASENHTLTYTANGSTITESCSANCGYSASLTLKAPANLVYDRTEKAATVEGEIIADYKLTYSADAVIMAGDYTATLTVGDYSVSLAFTIAKADPDVVTPSGLKATYGQTLADVELPGGWAWKNSSASVGSVGSNTFAAIYTPANISNFNTLERDLTVVVAKAMPTVTAPVAADDLVYNGTAQTLITAGTATGGTMQYSLDGSNWSETIPTGKDAKTYTVYYKVVGDGNHNDADGGSLSVTIAPKVITNPVIEGIDAQYLHTGSAITPVPTAVKDGNTVIDPSEYTLTYENNINEGTATLKIVDAANGNYTVSGSKTFQIVVHAHVWNYSVSGNTITATCNGNFGTCPDAEQSITLQVPDSYTYSGEALYSASVMGSIDGVTYTVNYTGMKTNYSSANAPVNADTYTVTLTAGGKSVSGSFTINPKNIANCTAKLSESSFTYDGKAPALTVSVVDSGVGSTPLAKDTDYTVGTVQVNAGSHKLTVTGIGNYTGTVELDYTITAKEVSIIGAAIQSVTYDPNGYTLTVTGVTFDGVVDGENLAYTAEATLGNTNAVGEQDATVTVTLNNSNYNLVTATYQTKVTINKAAATVTAAPTPNDLTYTGEALYLISAGEANGGTMQYSTDNQTWSTTIPQGTDAGEYIVYYKVVGDENHSDTATDSVEVTITKAQAVITVDTTTISVTYGETVSLPTATTNFGTVSCDKTADELVNAGTYTVTYTVEGTDNYEGDTKTVTVTIEKLAVAEPTVTGTYTYTGSEQTVMLRGVESCMTVASGDKATNAGSYEVEITLDGNHQWAEGSDGKIPWSIDKAKAEISVNTDPITVTYGETVTLPTATTNFGDVDCDKTAADLVNTGTYTVTYTVAGTDNFEGDTKTLTVIVAQKAVAEPTVTGTYTYTGEEQIVTLAGVESYMTVTSGNKGINAGNYEGIITLDGNHKWADGSDGKVQWSIGKAQAQISINTDPITVIYGETVTLPTVTTNFGTVVCDKTAADLVNAGTYTVTYIVAGTDNYDGDTKTVTVKINPKAITEDDVQLNGSLVYTGSEQTQQITVTAGIDFEVTGNKATNVGSYTLTVTASGNYTGSVTKDWSIKAAAAIVETAPKANNLTYTGEALALVTAGTTEDGKLVYSLSENGTYTENIPTGTNASDYTVWYYVQGDDNHADSAKASMKVTIAKAKAEISVVTTPITVTYGDAVKLPTATSNFGEVDCDTTAAELVNAGTYTVTYTVDGTDNYDGDTKTVTVTIEKLAVAEPTVTSSHTYTKSEQTVELAGVESYMTVASGDKATNAGSYEVEITLDGNHKWADGSDGKVQWSIGKAQAQISVNTDPITVTYGETVTLPTATTNFGAVVCDKTAADLVNAGTYTVTYTVAGTDNFEGDTKSITVTVNAKAITVTAEAKSKTYGDADPKLTYTVVGLENNDTLTGELKRAAGENVGAYAIEQGTLTAGNNYTITYTGAELTITAKAITKADVALDGSLTYTGEEQTQPIAVTEGITYTVTGDKATDVGTYELTVKGTDNYTGEVKLSWSIKAAAATVDTAPKANNLTYTGEALALVTAGTTEDGKLVYSLSENGTYTETIPTGTNAGDYTVWYYVQGDANHADSAKASVKVTIAKAQAEITVDTTPITVTYGEAVTLPIATANFGEVDCDKTAAELVNAGTYTVTYTVDGTDNYEGDSKTVTVTIEKLAVAEPTVSGTYTYTGKEQMVTLTGVESYMTVASGDKATNAGSYEVEITLDGNHQWADGSDGKVQWSIGKAEFGDVYVSQSGMLTYNKAAQTPNVNTDADSVGNQTATFTYRLTENESYGEMPAFTDAGTYTVYFKASAPNHKDATGSFTVMVDKAKAEITVDTDPITVTYGDTVELPDATANFGTVSCDKTAAELVNVGTYTVTYTVAGTDNYDGDTKTVTVKINPKAITEDDVQLNGSLVYTGSEQTQQITVTAGIDFEVTGNKATNVGSYTLTVTASGNYTGSVTKDWSIKAAAAIVETAPKANNLTYTGEAQELVTAGTAKGGKLVYSLTEDGEYTETIPAGTNVGEYTVWYYVDGDYNHSDSAKASVKVTIAKAKAEISVDTTPITVTYGETVELPNATSSFGTVSRDKTAAELVNAGTYTVTYSVAGTDNYEGDTKTVTVTINAKAIVADDVKLIGSLTYNGKEQTQTITVTDGITYEISGNKATKAGKYELTVKGTGNYTGTITLDWEISKAAVTITANNQIIYIGEDIPVLTYKVSGLIGDDKLTKNPSLTTNADEDQAGSYTITVTDADAGDNYTIAYVSGKLTIMDQETEVETKIEQTKLTKVPDGLKGTEFDTVDEIKEELISKILATATGYSAENMEHYDVTLQFSLDGGHSWIRASEENFPTEGITLILPYPEGTNARDYDFVVSHMFSVTSQRLGITAGDVELPKVEETANGIRVTLNGLSPVTVAARYHDHTGGTATCSDKAICSICGTAYGELDATNHAGGTEVKNAKEATCGAEGYTGDTHCKGCGEIVEKGAAIKATGEHTYGDWKVVKEPTKTAKGEKQRTCSVCGHVDSKEIPVLSDTPATGDDSNIMLYSSMFTVSLAGLVVLLLAAKKRKQENA